jgi:transcriptional regulator with XRE-family HTH domain
MTTAKTPNEILSEQLAEYRERRRLSQREFALKVTEEQRLLVSRATIARTEAGERHVPLSELLAFATHLGVAPPSLFLPRNGSEPVQITPTKVVSARQARLWIRGQAPLPDGDQREYLDAMPEEDWRAYEDAGLRFLLASVQRLVDAAVDDDRDAMADAVDAINDEIERLRTAQNRRPPGIPT